MQRYLLTKGYKILERRSGGSHRMPRFDPWIISSCYPKEVESLDRYLAEPLSPLNMAERTYYNFQRLYATHRYFSFETTLYRFLVVPR